MTPLGGIRPMNIVFYFNHRLIRNLGPNAYEFLIRNKVVHHFTLPNHERTNVHNRDNWIYDLECQSESPTLPETSLAYEHHPTLLSDAPLHAFVARVIPPVNHASAFDALRTDDTTLRDDVATIHLDFHSFMDVTHEQFDHIYQEIYYIRRFLHPTIGQSGWFLFKCYNIPTFHLNSEYTAPFKYGEGYSFTFFLV